MTWKDQDCDCNVESPDLGSSLFKLSAGSAAEFLRQASALVSSALPELETFHLRKMCEIPETPCPPKSLGVIRWHGCRGASLTHTIRITNTSDNGRVFTVSAIPFTEPGGGVASISLSPDTLKLSGNASGFIKAGITIPDNFPAGRYQTRIRVIGAYEQHIDVQLQVGSQQDCMLEVEQGDIPVSIKAHRWYHHFQCSEPCFPPARRETNDLATPLKRPPATDKGKG